jgi:hypothetical protein
MTDICERLHHLFNRQKRFRFPFDIKDIPANGIYILFESGEKAYDCDRIVRAGTHTGQGQLPSRLKQHFLKPNKDRSIFRKNIGRALLKKSGDPYAKNWEFDLTTRAARMLHRELMGNERQGQIECEVSSYIQTNFSFAVVEVPEKIDRLRIESRIISTVSNCMKCGPSSTWLGLDSPVKKICDSGLWLVNGLYKESLSEEEMTWLQKTLPLCRPWN